MLFRSGIQILIERKVATHVIRSVILDKSKPIIIVADRRQQNIESREECALQLLDGRNSALVDIVVVPSQCAFDKRIRGQHAGAQGVPIDPRLLLTVRPRTRKLAQFILFLEASQR